MISDAQASILMRDEFDSLGMVYICAVLGQAQLLRERADAMTAGAKRLLQAQQSGDPPLPEAQGSQEPPTPPGTPAEPERSL